MKDIRTIISENLTDLRKQKKLTQLELAEKFNYSDKAVSKWENGDTLPDIETLNELCKFYGVTLDYLTHEGTSKEKAQYITTTKNEWNNKVVISSLVISAVWILATVIFVYSIIMVPKTSALYVFWPIFPLAVPISSILGLICNRFFWKNKLIKFICLTVFIWSLIGSCYVTAGFIDPVYYQGLWSLFLIGVPIQTSIALWYQMRKNK